MNSSPIQPVSLVVTKLTIEADLTFKSDPQPHPITQVSLSTEMSEVVNPVNQIPFYRVLLNVTTAGDQEAAKRPYSASIQVVGMFVFMNEIQPLSRELTWQNVAINGLSIVYGFARDAIVHATAAGPFGAFILPAVNIQELSTDLLSKVQPPLALGDLTTSAQPSKSRRRESKARESR